MSEKISWERFFLDLIDMWFGNFKMEGLTMGEGIKFSFNTVYNSINGNKLPTVLNVFNIKTNIKNQHQETVEMINVVKQLETNVEEVQRATTSLKGFSVDLAG